MIKLARCGVVFMPENMQTKAVEAKNSRGFFRKVLRDFSLGCVAFLPLVVIAFIVYYLFSIAQYIGDLLFGITNSVWRASLVAVLVLYLLIYTGRKLRRREKWFLNFIEQLISKTPLIGGVYQAFKDMVSALTSGKGDRSYLGTVKVPCGPGYIIGFVTKKETGEDGIVNLTVFVPTSPNPTTGLVFFYPESEIEYLDMSPEKAFTRIISLGMRS